MECLRNPSVPQCDLAISTMRKVLKLGKQVEKKGIGIEIGWDGDIYLGFLRTYHEAMRGSEVFQG